MVPLLWRHEWPLTIARDPLPHALAPHTGLALARPGRWFAVSRPGPSRLCLPAQGRETTHMKIQKGLCLSPTGVRIALADTAGGTGWGA